MPDGGTVDPAAGDRTLTKVGETIGTVSYMAPEAISAAVKTDARVDVYALACVLHECLTGQPPFVRTSGMEEVIAHHLRTPPPRPSTTPGVPAAFDAVIAEGMAKDPDDRYQTVRELAAAARAAVGEATADGTPAVAARRGRRIRLSRKAAGLLATSVAVVAVAAVIIGVRLGSGGSGNSPTPIDPAYSSQIPLPFSGVNLPTGVAVDPAGNVYVADIGNDRVLKLAANASTPTPLPFTGLEDPRSVAVDRAGDIYIADRGNEWVARLAAGASTPTALPLTGLEDPQDAAVDTTGNVYVTDLGPDPVVKLPIG